MNPSNTCIVVQGGSNFLNVIKPHHQAHPFTVIYSTWKGEEHLYSPNDITIFNTKPNNPGK